MDDMIAKCTLSPADEADFFRRLIRFLFAAIKKKFSFDVVIETVKDKIYEKFNQKIWGNSDKKKRNFTPTFIFHYIYGNSN